ncbi:MAG: hypothetical protein ACNI28_09125 [Arcobacter sp.]|uniref:hypothetical protein n=1 Tax=Arcobacter sp. TaxID=1872629 RepID=UPI003AFFC798
MKLYKKSSSFVRVAKLGLSKSVLIFSKEAGSKLTDKNSKLSFEFLLLLVFK